MSRAPEERLCVYRVARTLFFFEEITAASVCEAIRLLTELEGENKKPIEFIINTGGGSCYDGLALYDKLRASECEILMVGMGLVASMGLIVYLAGDTRILTENTRLLNHQMSGGVEGMKVSDIGIDYKETLDLDNIMVELISERTGISISKVKKDVKVGDRWFSAEEALEEGYAHEVIINKRTRRRRKRKK